MLFSVLRAGFNYIFFKSTCQRQILSLAHSLPIQMSPQRNNKDCKESKRQKREKKNILFLRNIIITNSHRLSQVSAYNVDVVVVVVICRHFKDGKYSNTHTYKTDKNHNNALLKFKLEISHSKQKCVDVNATNRW